MTFTMTFNDGDFLEQIERVYGYANTYGLFHIIYNMSLYRSFLMQLTDETE